MNRDYTLQDWLPKVKPNNIKSVGSHPQLRAVRSFQWMVHWWLLAHIGWLFSGLHDSVTNLNGKNKNKSDAHVQHQIQLISQMHLEFCARHCFMKKSESDKSHVKMPKFMFNTIASYMHFWVPLALLASRFRKSG